MRFHVGAEDGVDAGLLSAFAAESTEQVGIQAQGDDFFRCGQDDLGGLPELRICGAGLGIGADVFANLGWRPLAETALVGRLIALLAALLRYYRSVGPHFRGGVSQSQRPAGRPK